MSRLACAIISFLIFMLEFALMLLGILLATAEDVWEALWIGILNYHNRIQEWDGNSKDIFLHKGKL